MNHILDSDPIYAVSSIVSSPVRPTYQLLDHPQEVVDSRYFDPDRLSPEQRTNIRSLHARLAADVVGHLTQMADPRVPREAKISRMVLFLAMPSPVETLTKAERLSILTGRPIMVVVHTPVAGVLLNQASKGRIRPSERVIIGVENDHHVGRMSPNVHVSVNGFDASDVVPQKMVIDQFISLQFAAQAVFDDEHWRDTWSGKKSVGEALQILGRVGYAHFSGRRHRLYPGPHGSQRVDEIRSAVSTVGAKVNVFEGPKQFFKGPDDGLLDAIAILQDRPVKRFSKNNSKH